MKLNYEEAVLEVITFDFENVIRTSGLDGEIEGPGEEENIGGEYGVENVGL